MQENSKAGAEVALARRLAALDPDLADRAGVRLELYGKDSEKFRLEPDTGKVSLLDGIPDREDNEVYYLRLRAVDAGGNVGEAQLVIHVTDRNDHQPRVLKLQVREFNARRCAYRLFVGYKEPVKSISIRNFTVHNTLFKTQRVALIPSSFSRRKKSIHGIKFKTEVFTVLLLRQFNDSLKKYRFNR